MRIALLAPLPPEQTGIADYAAHFRRALEALGVEVRTPLVGCGVDEQAVRERLDAFDWRSVDLVHAELGGGRLGEFAALNLLRQRYPRLPLTATVHDPERLVWRARLPWPLHLAERLPRPMPQVAALLADPLTLRSERHLARSMNRLITLTRLGGDCLRQRMDLPEERIAVIPHGNLPIDAAPLPPLLPLRLLYFGFIYRGKGIEDLLDAFALSLARQPELRGRVRLTLAGGTAPDMAFGPAGSYLDELRARLNRLQLSDCVDWQLDLPANEIPRLIQDHHVMVLPYRESKKLSLLGAMRGTSGALSWAAACGRGAVTSDARAFAEEVAHGNGALYPQGDVETLSQRLSELANQPERALQWAEQASRIGLARNWSATAERFRNLFAQEIDHVA
jgi:glycosyltransferase involved in cell wall biosynthesis